MQSVGPREMSRYDAGWAAKLTGDMTHGDEEAKCEEHRTDDGRSVGRSGGREV